MINTKTLAETPPEAQEPELAARSENADVRTQELSPAYVQEVGHQEGARSNCCHTP